MTGTGVVLNMANDEGGGGRAADVEWRKWEGWAKRVWLILLLDESFLVADIWNTTEKVRDVAVHQVIRF